RPRAPDYLWAPMNATLIESPDEHHWVLLDHRVTQLVIEPASLRVQTWSLDASAEIRLAGPFTVRVGEGAERALDPAATESLAPALALLRRSVRSLTITREGELSVVLGDGMVVRAAAGGGRHGGWELQGGGALEGMSYHAGPGAGAPWE
ncbi:MAG TPA: DUF6188 family protein, partial [Gemmatimonadaceae bacterium]|nr:DUF6188 family protein [Gemmatimonadaceae bacterium]